MTDIINHYIDGRVVEGKSGRLGEVYNPAIGEVVRQVALASAAETRAAVAIDHDLVGGRDLDDRQVIGHDSPLYYMASGL